MFRIDDASAAAALPTPEAAGTEGYFTEGSPGVTNPTLVRASFLNMIQEELRAIVVAGGLTPSKTTYNQILTALRSTGVFQTPTTGDRSTKAATTQMFANEFASSITSPGWFKRPDGLIEQFGSLGSASSTSDTLVTYPIAFPNGVLSFIASHAYTAGSGLIAYIAGAPVAGSKTQAVVRSTSGSLGFFWRAIGY